MSGGNATQPAEMPGQLSCASLVDAMGRIHTHRAHILPLASPDPVRRLFGPAATIAYLPYRDDLPQTLTGFGALFHQAVGEEPGGRVLVLSSGGYPEASHGSGTKLSRVANLDLAGVLADGRYAISRSCADIRSPPGAGAKRSVGRRDRDAFRSQHRRRGRRGMRYSG
ncbi:RraA family protein [Arthrobacter monumenti]